MLGAAALLLPTGCSLDEYNPSSLSADVEWTTPEGYEKKINDCYYDLIRIIYGQAEDTYIMFAETGTDIWQDTNPTASGGGWTTVQRYNANFSGSGLGLLWEFYDGFYGCLSACNGAIDYASKVKGASEAEINALVAEAHFIRAHVLKIIVEHFGGKYLPTSVGEFPEALPCSKVNEFYDVILADLEFAKQYLPVQPRVKGTVTRAAAYHLYAKSCLQYSAYTDGLGNCDAISADKAKELVNNARTAADYLINNAASLGVELYGESADIFSAANNKNNVEALFVVTHSSVQAYNPRGNYYNRCWKHMKAYKNADDGICIGAVTTVVDSDPKLNVASGNCYTCPSYYMLNLYGEKDTRYAAYFSDVLYANNVDKSTGVYTWTEKDANRFGLDLSRVGNAAYNIARGDTAVYLSRKKLSEAERNAAKYAIYNIDDNYANPAQPKKFFPSLKKFDHPELYCHTNAKKPYSSTDCIIYRLAETYLLSAEAAWRAGDTKTAVDRINVIRNRACEGHDGSMNISEADLTQDFLLDEYARELIGEWSRWTTLKRFRAFESRIAKCNPQITEFDKSKHYLRPIHSGELLLITNPEEYQNPGY